MHVRTFQTHPATKKLSASRGTMKVLNFSLAKRQGESNDIVLANQIFPGILEMPFQGGSMPPDLSFLGAGGINRQKTSCIYRL